MTGGGYSIWALNNHKLTFPEHRHDGIGHGFGTPGLDGAPLSEAQVLHQTLFLVPGLLPGRLQLVLERHLCNRTGHTEVNRGQQAQTEVTRRSVEIYRGLLQVRWRHTEECESLLSGIIGWTLSNTRKRTEWMALNHGNGRAHSILHFRTFPCGFPRLLFTYNCKENNNFRPHQDGATTERHYLGVILLYQIHLFQWW